MHVKTGEGAEWEGCLFRQSRQGSSETRGCLVRPHWILPGRVGRAEMQRSRGGRVRWGGGGWITSGVTAKTAGQFLVLQKQEPEPELWKPHIKKAACDGMCLHACSSSSGVLVGIWGSLGSQISLTGNLVLGL